MSQSNSQLSSISASLRKDIDIHHSLDQNHSIGLQKDIIQMLTEANISYEQSCLQSLDLNQQIYLKNCLVKYKQLLDYKRNLDHKNMK